MTGEPIRSRANALVKLVREVRARRRDDLVVVEGERLVAEVASDGRAVEAILALEELDLPSALVSHPQLRRAAPSVMEAVSGLSNGPGVVALVAAPALLPLDAARPVGERALLLCVSGVADPGNLGALARSAEAVGAQGVAIARGGAHPFGDKALRGSMGSLLRLPVHDLDDPDVLAVNGWRSVVAATRDGVDFRAHDWSGATALWVTGETGRWAVEPPADAARVTIGMAGATESLNAACAATLLLFEATRNVNGGE